MWWKNGRALKGKERGVGGGAHLRWTFLPGSHTCTYHCSPILLSFACFAGWNSGCSNIVPGLLLLPTFRSPASALWWKPWDFPWQPLAQWGRGKYTDWPWVPMPLSQFCQRGDLSPHMLPLSITGGRINFMFPPHSHLFVFLLIWVSKCLLFPSRSCRIKRSVISQVFLSLKDTKVFAWGGKMAVL